MTIGNRVNAVSLTAWYQKQSRETCFNWSCSPIKSIETCDASLDNCFDEEPLTNGHCMGWLCFFVVEHIYVIDYVKTGSLKGMKGGK
jgi:hypothetical protein